MNHTIPTSKLLHRLQLDALPAPDQAGLFKLTQAFRKAIPFENLDTLGGVAISSNIDTIAAKILGAGRGGWCYELNQLFGETLRLAGFDIEYRLGRVGYRRPVFGPLTHLVIQVRLDDQLWLVDVGFGGPGPTEPLILSDGEKLTGDDERFLLQQGADDDVTLLRWMDDEWSRLYRIEPLRVMPVDIEMASHFSSTAPQSPFLRMFMCVAFDGEFNWCLEGDELVQRGPQWRVLQRTTIEGPEHLKSLLASVFQIQLGETQLAAVWDQVQLNLAQIKAAYRERS